MLRKQRKVKRYHNIYRGSVTSSPFFKLGASAAALAVLIAAGWFLYEPVYQFVMGIGQEKEPVSTAEQPSEPESESDGFLSGLFGGGEESETESSQSQPETVEAVQLPWGVYARIHSAGQHPAQSVYPGLCFQWDQCHLL